MTNPESINRLDPLDRPDLIKADLDWRDWHGIPRHFDPDEEFDQLVAEAAEVAAIVRVLMRVLNLCVLAVAALALHLHHLDGLALVAVVVAVVVLLLTARSPR